ncbi:MAG TPA: hypothetical protein VFS83_14070 [Ktedonobacterales bacterium]|nr:hypothetical protein [Ktedonobacterales bacterium]
MDSVTLAKADAPRIIADVAFMLTGILYVLQPTARPRKRLGIWRTRMARAEDDLRALAAHPRLSPKSRKVLDRGFRAISRQIDRMQKEARRFASRTDAVATRAVQEEKLARNTEAAQMLRKRLNHLRRELEDYYATLATDRAHRMVVSDPPTNLPEPLVAVEDALP